MNKFKIYGSAILSLILLTILASFILLIYYVDTVWAIACVVVAVIIIDIGFGTWIINSQRHIHTKASWLLAIIALPFIGCIIFVIFGTYPMTRKRRKDLIESKKVYNQYEDYSFSKKYIKSKHPWLNTFNYAYFSSLSPIYKNNSYRIITSNSKLYEEYINIIRSAKHFIHLQTFIVHDGAFFRTVCAELIKKAKEGVKIRFLYDWYGGYRSIHKKQIRELILNDIEVKRFNKPGVNVFKSASNFRLHQKALIVDNINAIYGGSNIADDYLAINREKYFWRDQNYFISGEIVNSMNICFIDNWFSFTDSAISQEERHSILTTLKLSKAKQVSTNISQFSCSLPNYVDKNLTNTEISMFLNAKKSIKLISPFFIPVEQAYTAITLASKSGVKTDVIVPCRSDFKGGFSNDYIIEVNRTYYGNLLNNGVNVYEYNGFIHTKIIIIDDEVALMSTANFDYRSQLINFENSILIHDKTFVKQLSEYFQADIKNSTLITKEFIKERNTVKNTLRNLFLNLYRPLL